MFCHLFLKVVFSEYVCKLYAVYISAVLIVHVVFIIEAVFIFLVVFILGVG